MTRTPLTQLSAAQLNALPKTTRWRAEKRGWVALNYHQPRVSMRCQPALNFDTPAAYELAGRIVYSKLWKLALPLYLSPDDVIQECVFELWRVSAKEGYPSKKWQAEVICRRLLRLQQGCKGDADRFNRAGEPDPFA